MKYQSNSLKIHSICLDFAGIREGASGAINGVNPADHVIIKLVTITGDLAAYEEDFKNYQNGAYAEFFDVFKPNLKLW